MAQKSIKWSVDEATRLYQIDRWGEDYFKAGADGRLLALPRKANGPEVPLNDIVAEAASRGIFPPFVIRLQDVLRNQVESINQSFMDAISEAGYSGRYRGVFPIKVNHLREVVEEIMDAGAPYHFGLEVGSKPELIAALALHEDPESLLICNGYKDDSFIRLALSGLRIGKRIILVIEKLEELARILELADEMEIKPQIGIRIRIQTKGQGKWATSGGDDSKFGLNTSELMEATALLNKAGRKDSLQLIHFHAGSQISNIGTVGQAVLEISRYYAKLRKMGFPVELVDVGGGLGVDYSGARSISDSSMNYTLSEYTRKVVNTIQQVCEEEKVPSPDIVSESGRALVAHHSLLVVDVFGAVRKKRQSPPPLTGKEHRLVQDMAGLYENLTRKNRRETLHEAVRLKAEASSRFELGILDLEEKAGTESWFWHVAMGVSALFPTGKRIPQEIAEIRSQLGDQYLCNFSIFQSLIDYWAVGQLFPIAPLQRLNEKPGNQVTLVDITCDSDGKINRFIGENTERPTLPLHHLNDEPYRLGIFLVGAYQDVMGDIHNLFGPVPEIHIFLDEDESEGFYVEEIIPGNKIREVLADVQYEPRQLVRLLKKQVDQAIRADVLKPSKGMQFLRDFEAAMDVSTYLDLHKIPPPPSAG